MKSSLLLIASAGALFAQGTATLFGTASDSAGAVMPGVAITATHVQTGVTRQATTDSTGGYTLVQLPVGVFTLRAQAQGFKEYVQNEILLQVNENRRADFSMQLGQVTEQVEVSAQAAQVETRNGTIAEVIDSRRITDLPLNGRNPVSLQLLVAGAGRRGGRDQQQNETISVNGSGFRNNNYALDGGDNHDPFFNTPAPFPNPDALQEFSIETNGYGAEKGRNSGVFVSAVTKSGTNQIHATLFEYLRNDKLNSRDFFATRVPPFKRNQFGGTVGGPVRRDRTFFFGSYQATRERSAPGVTTSTVPTADMRRGDFSGVPRVVRDPNNNQPFAGNIIPASRIYQPSIKFMETFVPLPNLPGGLLSFASDQGIDDDQAVAKIDHQWSEKHRMFWRLLYNFNDTRQAVGTIPKLLASIVYRNWNGTYGDTWLISPTMVNSLTFTAQNIRRQQAAITPGNMGWRDFGSGIVRAHREDTVAATDTTVTGYFQAFTRHPLFQERHFFHIKNDLIVTRQAHLIKAGGEWRYDKVDRVERFQGDPAITFRGQITGDAAADLIIGRPDSVVQSSGAESFPIGQEMSLYIQDDWKVRRRLTLNLGLRWDPFLPPSDKRGTGAMFRAGQQSRFFPRAPLGMVYWAKDPSVPEPYGFGNLLANFAPRFGFAYDPFGDGKSSVRGGYGIFYGARALQQIGGGGPGYVLGINLNPVPGGMANPYQSIGGNPYPFDPPGTDSARASFEFVRPVSVGGWAEGFRNAVVQQWNFSVQRQLWSSWVVTAAYVASKGNHLETSPQINPGVFGRPGNLQQRRRFPDFSGIAPNASDGNMTYHSMQLTANKRLTRGLTVLASYTWARNIDNLGNPQDGEDFNREKAVSSNNIDHRFVGSFIWELPRLRNASKAARFLIDGWELNGIASVESGLYFTVVSGRDNTGTGVNQDRPDLVGNPFLPTSRPRGEQIARYYDPAAFRQNAAGTLGNAGRNLIPGPGEAVLDLGLVKTFYVTERHRVTFRTEAFNAFNRVNLDNPNGNLLAPNVGRITGSGPPRVFQLALRYQF
ncbi:MAG: carboxypeptidase regulatory-like domain-containing protein [Acidobacteria bacterium]|nr:carboxypeptidase regulatory-like domain-containing protein [Acidobacteriota bacterium]